MGTKKTTPAARFKKKTAGEKKKNRKMEAELKTWTAADEAKKEFLKEQTKGVALKKALGVKKNTTKK